MCGIVGVFNIGAPFEEQNYDKKRLMMFFALELLKYTEVRGKDATGITTFFDNGDYVIQKSGITASEFLCRYDDDPKKGMKGYANVCLQNESPIRGIIGHCRKSSVGNTTDNKNNHPVKANNTVGVHNGTLENHNVIFEKLKCQRDGVVDSEAIFRLVDHYTEDNIITLDTLTETTKRLQGSYSCLCYNVNNPYIIGLMRKERPMEYMWLPKFGLLLIASEKTFFAQAIFAYNNNVELYGYEKEEAIKQDDITTGSMIITNYVGTLNLTVQNCELVSELLDKRDILAHDKLWQVTGNTNTYYYGSRGRTTYGVSGRKSTTTKKETTTKKGPTNKKETTTKKGPINKKSNTTKKATNDFNGLIFCSKKKAYVTPEDVIEAAKVGAIEVDVKTGKVDALLPTTTTHSSVRFKNEEELIAELGLVTTQSLHALSPLSLANKVWALAKKIKNNKETTLIGEAKKWIALLAVIGEVGRSKEDIKEAITTGVSFLPKRKKPSKDTAETLFSVGDVRERQVLKTVIDEL